MKLRTLLVLLPLFIAQAFAGIIYEYQEVRLSKAQLAYARGNISDALRIISENIISRKVHINSYYFLSKIYMDAGEVSKAMRVHYLLIKRLHKDTFIKANSNSIKSLIKKGNIPPPDEKALAQYFHVANIYFNLAERRRQKGDLKELYYNNAIKYFTICDGYNYQTKSVNYYLGVLLNKQGNYRESIKKLVEVNKEFKGSTEETGEEQNVKFYLADSLLRSGQREAGAIFLQSVYQSPAAADILKDYSSIYLKGLNSNYFYLKLFTGIQHATNIHELNEKQLDDFDSIEYFYRKKSGSSLRKGFNTFANLQINDQASSLLSLSYADNLKTNKEISFQDNSYWYLNSELKYNSFERSIFKLSFSYTNSRFRETVESKLTSYSTTISISPSIIYEFAKGNLSFTIPFQFTKYKRNNLSYNEKGLRLNYTPIWVDEYFAPSYSFSYLKLGEENNDASTDEIELSFSNSISFTQYLNHYINLSLTLHSSEAEIDSYTRYRIYNALTLKLNESFHLSLSADYYIKDQKLETSIKNLILSSELSYIF